MSSSRPARGEGAQRSGWKFQQRILCWQGGWQQSYPCFCPVCAFPKTLTNVVKAQKGVGEVCGGASAPDLIHLWDHHQHEDGACAARTSSHCVRAALCRNDCAGPERCMWRCLWGSSGSAGGGSGRWAAAGGARGNGRHSPATTPAAVTKAWLTISCYSEALRSDWLRGLLPGWPHCMRRRENRPHQGIVGERNTNLVGGEGMGPQANEWPHELHAGTRCTQRPPPRPRPPPPPSACHVLGG